MSSAVPRAIVFNCHYNGLSIIQELGRHGVPCVAMDSSRSVGTFSRYARFVRCPDPAEAESEFVEFLYDFCAREEAKPVLFPTNDQWATALARHKERLAEVARPCVGDWEAVRRVIEKDEFYALGEQRGYMTPRTWDHRRAAAIPAAEFPIAAKPVFRRHSGDAPSRDLLRAMDRLRLTVLESPERLREFLAREERWARQLVFQSYVPGLSDSMYTVGVYADERHRVRAVFTGKKVRGYPADIGDCTVGEVRSVPEELVGNAERITRELGLSGIAEFEYKRDPGSGAFTLIEVNPRSWSWIGITPACGVNLPLIAYLDLTGRWRHPGTARQAAADGSVRYAKVLEDALNTIFRYRADHPAWARTPWAWWRELRSGSRLVAAEFASADPLVGLASVYVLARSLAARLASRGRGRRSAP